MFGVIYKIEFNSIVYIGSTQHFMKRLINHRSDLYCKTSPAYNRTIYKAFREAGMSKSELIMEPLKVVKVETTQELRQIEWSFILSHSTLKQNGIKFIQDY